MKINLPNQITIGRFFLAVVFLVLLACFDFRRRDEMLWMLDVGFILFVVAALSDALDGYLARKQNQVTSFGRIIDPFVDKILVVGGLVLLLGGGFRDQSGENATGLSAWMVLIVVARELLVSGLRGFSEAEGKPYASNLWGKIKMITQSITVGWIIASLGRGQDVRWIIISRPYVIAIMLGVTVVSVFAYLLASREALAEQSRE